MNVGKVKYIALTVICLGVCLLCACIGQQEYPPPLPASSATPPPINDAGNAADVFTANLYFLSDANTLSPELRTLSRGAHATRADVALRALVAGPETTLNPAFNRQKQKQSYARVELAGDLCMAYLSGAHHDVRDILPARAAVASTAYETEGTPYADVYVDGMQPGFYGRPLGALAPLDQSTNVNAQELSPSSDEDAASIYYENRNAPLFFTDRAGKYISCKVRPITYNTQTSIKEIIALLLDELKSNPPQSMLFSPLPADLQLIDSKVYSINAEKEYVEQPADIAVIDYESIVELNFSQPAKEFDVELTNAAITYTITSFLPKVSSVRITYNNIADSLQQTIPPLFTRQQFAGLLGHTITVFYPEFDGSRLLPMERLVSQENIYNPLYRLEVLSNIAIQDDTPLLCFEKEDFLSVTILGDLAVVNTRKGFYEKLASFSNHLTPIENAKMHVFSIINTLAGYPDINRVWLLEDGERIDRSLDMLYLGNALYANVGLDQWE